MGRRGAPRGRRDADRGAAAVEFALVSLPLFLILFGIIQYGFLFYEVQGASAASKDAAQWAAVGMDDCNAWVDHSKEIADGYGVGSNLTPSFEARYDLAAEPEARVTVTVRFTPLHFVPLVPVPDEVVRTASADVQRLPADPGLDAESPTCSS